MLDLPKRSPRSSAATAPKGEAGTARAKAEAARARAEAAKVAQLAVDAMAA